MRRWISLGENCLSDNLLERYDKKTFSSPYSSGRSNIDYAISLEKDDYRYMLYPEYLIVGDAWGKDVVRSTKYKVSDDIFDPGHSKGFEFTHHDVISDKKSIESYNRKIDKMLSIRGKEDVVFLYHHRRSKNSNFEMLRNKIENFCEFYDSENFSCTVILFYQNIISEDQHKSLVLHSHSEKSFEFIFNTHKLWGGNDPELLWGRVDEDLFKEMFSLVDSMLKAHVAPHVIEKSS